jgi:hypothetical protein
MLKDNLRLAVEALICTDSDSGFFVEGISPSPVVKLLWIFVKDVGSSNGVDDKLAESLELTFIGENTASELLQQRIHQHLPSNINRVCSATLFPEYLIVVSVFSLIS